MKYDLMIVGGSFSMPMAGGSINAWDVFVEDDGDVYLRTRYFWVFRTSVTNIVYSIYDKGARSREVIVTYLKELFGTRYRTLFKHKLQAVASCAWINVRRLLLFDIKIALQRAQNVSKTTSGILWVHI